MPNWAYARGHTAHALTQHNGILIYAKGEEGKEIIDLKLNGKTVATYHLTESYQEFSYTPHSPLTLSKVEVVYTNDRRIVSQGIDYNAIIDYIKVNGITYQTEHSSTRSKGSWVRGTGCREEVQPQSEKLHCNGYMRYAAEEAVDVVVAEEAVEKTEKVTVTEKVTEAITTPVIEDPTPPANAAPLHVEGTNGMTATVSGDAIVLNWQKALDAAGYSLYRNDKWTAGSRSNTFYTDTKVEKGQTYSYRVVRYTSNKKYKVIGTVEVMIPLKQEAAEPRLSTDLSLTNIDVTEAQTTTFITFTASAEVQAAINYGTNTSYGQTGPSVTTFDLATHEFTLENLTPGTTYYYKINVTGRAGQSVVHTGEFTTHEKEKSPPLITTPPAITAGDEFTVTINTRESVTGTDAWIGLYESHQTDAEYGTNWIYLNKPNSRIKKPGDILTVQYTAPTNAGTYEIRAFETGALTSRTHINTFVVEEREDPSNPHDTTIDDRKWPVQACAHIAQTPEHTRPVVDIKRSIAVEDFNADGITDGHDIQIALDTATLLHENDNVRYTVLLPEYQGRFSIERTLTIGDGVILQGTTDNHTILPTSTFNSGYLVAFEENTAGSGINNIKLETRYKAKSGAVLVGEGANSIFIYDNTFIDEIADGSGRKDEKGAGTGISMVRVGKNAQSIFIDGNFFLHVPTAISLLDGGASNVHITHNTISQWRQRAIYMRTLENADAITDIFINHNRINEPKIGQVRQPVASHSANDVFFERINVNFNNVYSPDKPHIWEYETDALGNTIRNTMLNNATADALSLHQTDGFNMIGNCIFNAGEVGITIARKSKNGTVANNYILGADTGAIAIGATPNDLSELTQNVTVTSNIIVNAGRNRDNSLGRWARTALASTNAQNIYYNGNNIIETHSRYDNAGNPLTLEYLYYDYNAQSSYGQQNTSSVPSHVVEHGTGVPTSGY